MTNCPHCKKEINIGSLLSTKKYSKIPKGSPERLAIGAKLAEGRAKARSKKLSTGN